MTSPKPPTQTAGVVGIEPKPIELTPAPTQRVNWRALAALPPFQMFVAERKPMPAGCKDSQDWALRAAQELAAQQGDQPLLDEYCRWHARKGYWPNETPLGAVAKGQ